MADLNPITLYGFAAGPNSWKVAILLSELGLPFDETFLTIPELKHEAYLRINPNGKVPAIVDPNNSDLTVFEVSQDVLRLS
jgi:glutathione S-transferase